METRIESLSEEYRKQIWNTFDINQYLTVLNK